MGKRRFAGSVSGFSLKTDASRYDSSGITGHIRGWSDGVKVIAAPCSCGDCNRSIDEFQIVATGGSNGGLEYEIGRIRHSIFILREELSDAPRF